MAIESFDPAGWEAAPVANLSDLAALKRTSRNWRIMLGAVLEAMLDRYERRADYPFIDTKLSLLDGRDFAADDPLRGPGVVYGWIQGRGLEALAGHAEWLARCDEVAPALKQRLAPRIRRMIAAVFERMESIRAANSGRLFFTMTPAGEFLRMADDGRLVGHRVPPETPTNTTELFYVKGMLAAARFLGDEAKADEARRWYDRIDGDVRAGRLARDQQPLDPTNVAVRSVTGRHSHGGRMLALGAAALLVEHAGEAAYAEMGLAYLDHILANHVNAAAGPAVGEPFDMWEFVGDDGRPWLDEAGALLSDPGHSTEMVGLALKFLAACEARGALAGVEPDRLTEYHRVLPAVLERNFANGFPPAGFGIVKAYDLIARRPLRTDTPWWNLPETMRAAAGACRVVPPERRGPFVEIASKCANAFAGRFLRPELHLMAYQTLDAAGEPIDVIPATPDADPGYHTGLSIIDYLDLLDGLEGWEAA